METRVASDSSGCMCWGVQDDCATILVVSHWPPTTMARVWPGQGMWDMWWTRCQWAMFHLSTLVSHKWTQFHPTPQIKKKKTYSTPSLFAGWWCDLAFKEKLVLVGFLHTLWLKQPSSLLYQIFHRHTGQRHYWYIGLLSSGQKNSCSFLQSNTTPGHHNRVKSRCSRKFWEELTATFLSL